ncbi:peptidyl-prolyl cis-trans isomerase CYP38, chloroplastic [Olea europaea subsp. europaea]|uniref:peptidylprolyl isomerase n=1 Tax=Olea europaea subsp. europaea TaxID=158383 RepID=A0A8S0T8B2_OLEEU|nr:peptidyl-prolyl cis-trans isomerase CYP38, chloroplastic [Olea europaea subsp. europaea]
MAALISCHHYSSLQFTTTHKLLKHKLQSKNINYASVRQFKPQCTSQNTPPSQPQNEQKNWRSSIKDCAISIALAVGLITGVPALGGAGEAMANAIDPALPDVSVLISGPPIKDPGALLRYALPIDNKAIREVQKPLEDITDSLKVAGVKALDSVERNVRQASRALKQGRTLIVGGLAKSKVDDGIELLNKLETGLDELQKIVEDRNRDAVAPKQKELLNYVGGVEEDMVDGFPYEVPEEYRNMPLLKGRATVDMKVKLKDNPNLNECVFRIVLDGYNAPVTAGNFVDLVERHFYDGMEIQRSDGFVVQTGDPEGPAEGFIDPSTEKTRTIPLEIMVNGEKAPFYGETLEELGLYKAQTKLPFNAFGTMAMAREVRSLNIKNCFYTYNSLNLTGTIFSESINFNDDRNLRIIRLRARYFGY